MKLLALIAALAWERYRPDLPSRPRETARRWMIWLREHVNAGGEQHGLLAWSLGVLVPSLGVGLLAWMLHGLGWPLGWVFDVAVAYFCLGFRRASYQAASVERALRADDLQAARRLLGTWRPHLLLGERKEDVILQAAEEVLRQSLVRLFGVLFWFVLFSGPGSVLYLLSHLARDQWHTQPRFGRVTEQVTFLLDWLPVRITAFSFAIVGNFQDAMQSWRAQAADWGNGNEGILLAAGAGALGLRLGGNVRVAGGELHRSVLGVGEPPEIGVLHGIVALVWRAALLWGAALGLFWLGSL
ncbi:MAG TPA: cobalamin biosynthesis protein [Thiobacillaceae bacterium]|nr:cobalamin biosynthesis protein [Thiobacillaceae bacterium]HNU63082.1 cobalamin biosynthesis protein [Thiobacillaceae bacterium]